LFAWHDDAIVVAPPGGNDLRIGCLQATKGAAQMPDRNLTERLEILEQRMDALETLPARLAGVETQILHLRDEMRMEFSAVRQEMRAGFAEVRGEMRAADDGLRADLTAEIRAGDERVRADLTAEIRAGDERVRADLTAEIRAGDERVRAELRAEIRAGDEETRRYMRVLHEDVIARLAVIQEGIRPPKRRR